MTPEKRAVYKRVRSYGNNALDAWKAACYAEEQRVVNILLGMPSDEELRDVFRSSFPQSIEIRGEQYTFKIAENGGGDWSSDFEYCGWKQVLSSSYRERREQRVFLLEGNDFNHWPNQKQIELYESELEMVEEYRKYYPKRGDAEIRRMALERRQALVKRVQDEDRGRISPGEYYLEGPNGDIVDNTFHSVNDTYDADEFIDAAREMLRSVFR